MLIHFLPPTLSSHIKGRPQTLAAVKEHMAVSGVDGVFVGTVDRIKDGRIKLTKDDRAAGHHRDHHHSISGALLASVRGEEVRLSANGDFAVLHESEADGKPLN
jgi:hypothetical protein